MAEKEGTTVNYFQKVKFSLDHKRIIIYSYVYVIMCVEQRDNVYNPILYYSWLTVMINCFGRRIRHLWRCKIRKTCKEAGITQSVRALASHQCSPGSIPGLGVVCGLCLLLLSSLLQGFFPGYSSTKSNTFKFQFDPQYTDPGKLLALNNGYLFAVNPMLLTPLTDSSLDIVWTPRHQSFLSVLFKMTSRHLSKNRHGEDPGDDVPLTLKSFDDNSVRRKTVFNKTTLICSLVLFFFRRMRKVSSCRRRLTNLICSDSLKMTFFFHWHIGKINNVF